jgi:hypothetical protein
MTRNPASSGPAKGLADPASVPAQLGEEINGPGKVFFDNVMFDNLLDALLELSAAVWTHHDRVIVLEKILAERGIAVSEAIEAHLPDDEEIKARAAERAAFVERVFGGFVRRPVAPPPDSIDPAPSIDSAQGD